MRAWSAVGSGAIGAAILLVSAPVVARDVKPGPPPPQVNELLGCRAIADDAQRLACYDKSAATIGDAVAKRELVVFDRESVKKTKRGLFGFSIPNLGIFGDDNDEVEIKQLDGAIAATSINRDGGYIFILEDNTQWSQMDSKPVALPPQRGDKVVVKKGTLGSYFLSFAGQAGVKVRRTK
jgi:hypothetical protein